MSSDNHLLVRIKDFNAMYGAPAPSAPTWTNQLEERLNQFKRMIKKEVSEVEDVKNDSQRAAWYVACSDPDYEEAVLDVMTSLSDWLIDIIVYCLSEATRHGIPIQEVFDIVMDSNASKLDENGQPIVVDGKIMKGPNYWKPEPKIRQLLRERMYGCVRVETKPQTDHPCFDVGGVEHPTNGAISSE